MPVANEGLGLNSLPKMVHNPGGDWHSGRGDNPRKNVMIVGVQQQISIISINSKSSIL